MTKTTIALLALAGITLSAPAVAQSWGGTATPYGGSIYGGPPTGYSFQFQQQAPVYQPAVPTYQRGCTTGLGQFTTYTNC